MTTRDAHARYANSLLVRALRGETVERTPIWIMRQAGRYMPEYRAIRKELSFLELCKNPRRAADVTLLPMEMLGVDAAIVFSDILVPVEAMGVPVQFGDGGPSLPKPVRTAEDAAKLRVPEPARDCPWAAETISLLLPELGDLPCLGFAGAPFTLATYMIEGTTSKSFGAIKTMMHRDPALLNRILEVAAETVAVYLEAQMKAGAAAVQLFDTWAGSLSPADYVQFALPWQRRALSRVAGRVPTILYVNGGGTLLRQMQRSGADVISLDWRVDMAEARARLGADTPVQGNLDPTVLYGPTKHIEARAIDVLRAAGPRGHVFNLGHGILPDVPVDSAKALVRAVQQFRHG